MLSVPRLGIFACVFVHVFLRSMGAETKKVFIKKTASLFGSRRLEDADADQTQKPAQFYAKYCLRNEATQHSIFMRNAAKTSSPQSRRVVRKFTG